MRARSFSFKAYADAARRSKLQRSLLFFKVLHGKGSGVRVVQTGRRFQPSALHLEELAADGERRTDPTQPYEVEQQQHLLRMSSSTRLGLGMGGGLG